MRVVCFCGAEWRIAETMGCCPKCGQVSTLPGARLAREMERELAELIEQTERPQ